MVVGEWSFSDFSRVTKKRTTLTEALASQERYDVTFLCCSDIPYDDTWDRSGETNRDDFHGQIVEDLRHRGVLFASLAGSVKDRIALAKQPLADFNKYESRIAGPL
jgi:HTH-type transcriptional repressor of NAD biosynthesis genes